MKRAKNHSSILLAIVIMVVLVGLLSALSDVFKNNVYGRGAYFSEDAAKIGITPLTGNLVFEGGQVILTVSTTGKGYVSSSPSGIICGAACSEAYSPGTVMRLTAKPQSDQFVSWGGACSGTEMTCTITLDADTTVIANFGGQSEPKPAPPSETPLYPISGDPIQEPVAPIQTPPSEKSQLHCCLDPRYNAEYALQNPCQSGFIDKGVQKDCSTLAAKLRKPIETPKPIPPTPPSTAPKYTLTVEKPSTGQIKSSDGKINCPNQCSAQYGKDENVVLQNTFVMDGNKKVKFDIVQENLQPPSPPPTQPQPPQPPLIPTPSPPQKGTLTNQNLAGSWRIYSQAIFYDKGGNSISPPLSRRFELKSDGTWEWGNSKGTWEIKLIEPEDWKKWSLQSYGPTSKIVFKNWVPGWSDGPIEESQGSVDFMWLIFRGQSTKGDAPPDYGTIQMKLGHSTSYEAQGARGRRFIEDAG
ncbi:hypothetical protein HYY69_04460 [Candidatus Woesearchaeota archaeon]|nr:hypothetical protein [Candidatus Woesearchaeota archaeon]